MCSEHRVTGVTGPVHMHCIFMHETWRSAMADGASKAWRSPPRSSYDSLIPPLPQARLPELGLHVINKLDA
jgi:hypothetical protein